MNFFCASHENSLFDFFVNSPEISLGVVSITLEIYLIVYFVIYSLNRFASDKNVHSRVLSKSINWYLSKTWLKQPNLNKEMSKLLGSWQNSCLLIARIVNLGKSLEKCWYLGNMNYVFFEILLFRQFDKGNLFGNITVFLEITSKNFEAFLSESLRPFLQIFSCKCLNKLFCEFL